MHSVLTRLESCASVAIYITLFLLTFTGYRMPTTAALFRASYYTACGWTFEMPTSATLIRAFYFELIRAFHFKACGWAPFANIVASCSAYPSPMSLRCAAANAAFSCVTMYVTCTSLAAGKTRDNTRGNYCACTTRTT